MSPQRCSGLPRWLSGKESVCQCRRYKRLGFDPWVRKIPWRRKWQPIPSSLPGKSHGQENLVGYSIWGHKESSWLSIHTAEMFKTCEYVTIYGKGDFGLKVNTLRWEIVVFVVQSLSRVWIFVTPWTAAHQASLSFTISLSLLKFMGIESMMPSNHLILCHPLLLLPSVLPSTKVFFNESAVCIR